MNYILRSITIAIIGVCISSAVMAQTAYTVTDFSLTSHMPGISLGNEFPGAQATGSFVSEAGTTTGAPVAARLQYDFTKGGAYVHFNLQPFMPQQLQQISFRVRGSGQPKVLIRLRDAKGETFQRSTVYSAAGQWQDIAMPISTSMEGWERWGGDNTLDEPLSAIYIGVGKQEQTGTLDLRSVAVKSGQSLDDIRAAALRQVKLALTTPVPFNLFIANEHVTGTLAIVDPSPDLPAIQVKPVVRDVWGNVAGALDPVMLNKENRYSAELKQLPYGIGCYSLELSYGDTANAPALTLSYAVAPVNIIKDRDVDSPFGVCTHFDQGWNPEWVKVAKRVGIAWIRDGGDRGAEVTKANKLCYMACFTWGKPDDKYRRPNDQWDFSEVAQKYADYAKKYGDVTDAYDFQNEPNNTGWTKLGGSWDGGPWLSPFMKFGEQVSAALHQADPTAPVVWEDGDMIFYPKYQAAGLHDAINVISPHPYNLHRTRPLPEQHQLFKVLPEYYQFLKANKLNWPVWSGEMGYSSYQIMDPKKVPTFYSPNTELHQAQLIARMVILQLAYGVKKVFIYDLKNDFWGVHDPGNPECNFGLLRQDGTPKPAIIAYANVIHQLYGCTWLGMYMIGGGGEGYAFNFARTGKPVLVAWLPSGEKTEGIYLEGDTKSVQVTDVFGGQKTVEVKNHILTVGLSETPIFIEGLEEKDIQRNLLPLPR
ncbi:MAG TPA: hypothetical protein VHV83_20775 [Armatimonadota bacterium]|nr:hypothetical protein [Armatimonadota bacterium]